MDLYTWTGAGNHSLGGLRGRARRGAARSTSRTSSRASRSASPSGRRCCACSLRVRGAPGGRAGSRIGVAAGARGSLAARCVGRRLARRLAWRPAPQAVAQAAGAGRGRRAWRRDAELALPGGAQNADGGFGGARRAGRAASSTRPGRRSASPRRARPAAACAATAIRCSTRSAPKPRSCTAPATSSARSSRCTPAAPRSARCPARRSGRPPARDRAPPTAPSAHLVNLTAFAILALRAAGYGRAHARRRRGGALARRASRTPTAASASRRAAGRATSTTPPPRCRRSRRRRRAPRGPPSPAASRYLRRAQNPDGGFPQQPGGPSNAQSTAWAIQGLAAAGRDPRRASTRGRQPLAASRYLQSLVAPDGSVRYSRTRRADAGVGHRAGAHRARREAVPGWRPYAASTYAGARPGRTGRFTSGLASGLTSQAVTRTLPAALARAPRLLSSRPLGSSSAAAVPWAWRRCCLRWRSPRSGRWPPSWSPRSRSKDAVVAATHFIDVSTGPRSNRCGELPAAPARTRRCSCSGASRWCRRASPRAAPRGRSPSALVLGARADDRRDAQAAARAPARPASPTAHRRGLLAERPLDGGDGARALRGARRTRELRPLVAAIGGAVFAAAVGVTLLVLAWHMPSDVLGGTCSRASWSPSPSRRCAWPSIVRPPAQRTRAPARPPPRPARRGSGGPARRRARPAPTAARCRGRLLARWRPG